MRLSAARIEPIADEAFTVEQSAAVEELREHGPLLNIYRTIAHAPKAVKRFTGWGAYVLSRRNALPAREREMVILRVGFLCRAGYEFAQHRAIGQEAGLTAKEIERIKIGADAGWSEAEQALIRAADELVRDHFVSDATWHLLGRHFDTKQCMDVVFTVGQYTQVSMLLNSFGVQIEDGEQPDPDLDERATSCPSVRSSRGP
jgi:4-carboxymuconolactone decarboxylase